MSKNKAKKSIAIFDIDGTIFRSSLLIEFNKGLVDAKIIPKQAVKKLLPDYFAWRNRVGSYDKYLTAVIEMHASEIKNKKMVDCRRVAKQVFDKHKDRVYRFTRAELQRLQKTHFTVAISGSPQEMVSQFAKYYKFDAYHSTVYEVTLSGVYTGQIADRRPIGMKAQLVQNIVEDHNLTLKNSWGFGDTENDIGVLSLVDNAVAINPSSGLFVAAKNKGWKVVVERKDLVYEM